MFERFTDQARRVVVLSQEEARMLHHDWIGTEHLLLGLLHEGEGIAARALAALGISLEATRTDIQQAVGRQEPELPTGQIPFTPRSKKVLELSLREALQLGHSYISTEHLLLGIVRERKGVAAQVLQARGAALDRIRREVISLLSSATATRIAVGAAGPPGTGPLNTRPAPYTPAAAAALDVAYWHAGGGPVGTQHLLSALAGAEGSVAQRVLGEAGVDRESLVGLTTTADPKGTTDEAPEAAGARRTSIQLMGDKIAVLLDDPAQRELLGHAMARGGHQALTTATGPAHVFEDLWRIVSWAVREVVAEVVRETGAPPGWRPPEWPARPAVANCAVISAPSPHLVAEYAEGVDRQAVRAGLAAWLADHRPSGEEARRFCDYLAVTVGPAADPGGWGEVTHFGGHLSVELAPPTSTLRALVEQAIADLAAPEPPTTPETPDPPPAGA